MFHGWHEENIRNRRERFAAPGSNVEVQKGPRVMNPKETNVELIPMSVRRNIQNVQDIQDHSSDPENVCSRKTQGLLSGHPGRAANASVRGGVATLQILGSLS